MVEMWLACPGLCLSLERFQGSTDASSHSDTGRHEHISEFYMASLPAIRETVHRALHSKSRKVATLAMLTATRTQMHIHFLAHLQLF